MARRRAPGRRRRVTPDRVTKPDQPLRLGQTGGSKVETYRMLPLEPGADSVGWVRRRARAAQGVPVNARMDLPWKQYPWIHEDEFSQIACRICGTTLREERFGVSWKDGEERIRALNRQGGGYRSRGPVLWAMHVIKFERFADQHMVCEVTFPDPATRPPEDIAWLCIWGDACDMATAVYDDPSLLMDYWDDFALRNDAWSPAVRRRLRRAYAKDGTEGVRKLMGQGVEYTTTDDDGNRVKRVWEFLPF